MQEFFFAHLKSLKKGVRSEVGSGSVSQRYGSADPDPHQHFKDAQHCHVYNKIQGNTVQNTRELLVPLFYTIDAKGSKS
jgi:hypothetical protein